MRGSTVETATAAGATTGSSVRRAVTSSAGTRARTVTVAVAVGLFASVATVASAAVITGNAGDNTLRGTNRADRIDGRAGDDTLLGRRGRDRLTGGRDDDRLRGGQTGGESYLFDDNWGNDTVSDPAGTDTLDFSAVSSGMLIDLVPSASNEANAGAPNTVDFPASTVIEDAIGGSGPDSIFGTEDNNALSGNSGGDEIHGRGGDDALNGGDGGDFYAFDEGWGSDTLTDLSGDDTLDFSALSSGSPVQVSSDALGEASSSTDILAFSPGQIERIQGGAGSDRIFGNSLGNYISGNAGDDELYGSSGGALSDVNTLDGGVGNDTLRSNSQGSNSLIGGPGNDNLGGTGTPETVDGGTGTDVVETFGGGDTVDVSDGDAGDTVDCGTGTDTVVVDAVSGSPIDSTTNCEAVIPQGF